MATTKAPSKTASRAKRTKAEVQQAFKEVEHEVESARGAVDRTAAEAANLRQGEVRQAVEGLSVESVIRSTSSLGLEISKALADLSRTLTQEVERLSAVREAIEIERAELARLHKIDIAATALDHLVEEYERKQGDLEQEISAQRTAWEQEQETSERDRKEQEEALRKQRQREIDDYEYKKASERKKAQDKYDEEMRLQQKQNQEKQEALVKSWQQREAALKEQEEELARLRKEAADFPARLKKEADAAAGLASKAAEQKYEQQLIIAGKDAESEKRLGELQIKTLEGTIARQATQIEALQKQVDEAKQQVQEIAVRAIEGASGARALSHINQIAMEQAKHRPQGS